MKRRSFLRGLFAAPAIIAADRLMPVKLWKPPPAPTIIKVPNGMLVTLYGAGGGGGGAIVVPHYYLPPSVRVTVG